MFLLKCILVSSLLLGIARCFSTSNRSTLRGYETVNINNDNNNLKIDGKGWHIHVTLHVYSGRPDPTWFISDTHPSYKLILRNMGTIPAKPLPSRLGYKGFSLAHIPPGGSVTRGGYNNRTVTLYPDWELFLLQTAEGVENGLKIHAKQTILHSMAERKRRSNSLYYPGNDYIPQYDSATPADPIDPIDYLTNDDMLELAELWGLDKRFKNITTTPTPLGPTKFEPEKWNKYLVKDHNNCYNYANNRITDTFAQPGRAGNCDTFGDFRYGADVEKLSNCDGLETVFAPDSNKLPKHSWNLVALVFWPPEPEDKTYDFHWYRLDGNGRWSHKPGGTSATNVDDSGELILDPRHADRGPYKEFVSFLQTRQDKIVLI